MISKTLTVKDKDKKTEKGKEFKDFIEKELFSEELFEENKKDKTLEVRVNKEQIVDFFSEDFYNEFVNNSNVHVSALEETILKLVERRDDVEFEDVNLKLVDFIRPTDIGKLRTKDVGKLVCIEGIISLSGTVKPLVNKALFRCTSCNETNQVIHTKDQMRYPSICSNSECGNSSASNFELVKEKSESVDFQKVNIKEPPEEAEGNPERLLCNLFSNEAGETIVSERVKLIGVLKGDLERTSTGLIKSPVMDKYLHVISVQKEQEDFEDLEPTEEEEKKIDKLSNNPDIYKIIQNKICPSLKGYDKIKEAITLQLFSGVTKKLDGGKTHLRGDIHILIVGDPALGKSQLLKFVGEITPRGTFSSGKGSTGAGLTASAVEEDIGDGKEWIIKAGTLALADGGIACIDEFDKMSQNDRDSIHEALAQQTISVDKAGMKATLNSRCAVLASSNPEEERFVPDLEEYEQIGLEPALRSRFDLIFTVKDQVDEEKDRKLAQHIMDSHREKEETEEEIPDISHEMFKKYIAYARKNCEPKLTDQAEKILNDYYIELRKESDERRVSVTVRTLQGLIRLAEASAKVRLSEKVRGEDANRAKRLMEMSLNDAMRDGEGNLDADIKETSSTAKQRQKRTKGKKNIRQIVREIEKEETERSEKGEAHKEEIIENAKIEGLTQEKAEKHFMDLRDSGMLYKVERDIYSLA